MHSKTKCPPASRLASSSFDVIAKSIATQKSASPPHSTIAGIAWGDGVHGLISPPTPPESEMIVERCAPRPPASCPVNSAPALTPALDTHCSFTLNCSATHPSMSSKNSNSCCSRISESISEYGHLNSRSSAASGITAINRH